MLAGAWMISLVEAGWVGSVVDPEWRKLAGDLSWWGEFHRLPLGFLAAIGLAGWSCRKSRWVAASLAGLQAGLVAGLIVMAAKIIFGRPRPAEHLEDGFYWFKLGSAWASFPSGHAAHCFAMAVGAAVVLPRLWPISLLGAGLVAWSRFALDRHYPSDLLAGAWLGITAGVLFGLAARRRLVPGAGTK
jgi:undecaprenyl-diphosphatase